MPEILEWLGYGLCHQLPERSIFAAGIQLPVCARDTGIYMGFAIALGMLWLLGGRRRPTGMPPWPTTLALTFFVLLMVLDGVTSYAGLRNTTNELRMLTGLATGFAIAALTVPLLNAQLWARSSRDRLLGSPLHALGFFISFPLAYGVVWYIAPLSGVVYVWLVALVIVVTFTTVNLVIVTLLPPFERAYERLRDAWLPVSLAVALSLVELALASGVKVWLMRLANLA
ncbi:MAG: DUF2085 domain-containing protein [Coriobacteriia bacterium]|nr:DUF2085 domain-containing protein [Coriobacteriia bacterium]